MYTLYKFHFLNGISEINQLFDDILIIWPAPVCMYVYIYIYIVQIHKNTGEPKNLWELKDFSEEQKEVELFRTNGTHEQLSLNKTKPAVDHSGSNTVLRIKCM